MKLSCNTWQVVHLFCLEKRFGPTANQIERLRICVCYRTSLFCGWEEDIEFWNLLSVAMFIVQVLGIVQLTMFVRGRIFLFIFGGEDAWTEIVQKR